MPIDQFPPVENAAQDGLLAIGGDLHPETLILAYKSGIFPWPIGEDYPLAWFSPDPRGILFYNNLHISKSMQKIIRQNRFDFAINKNFHEVIYQCAYVKRTHQHSTWITTALREAFINLHRKRNAYCAEAYDKGKLVGGLYGFCYGRIITAESMFFLKNNASKFVLIKLMDYLATNNIFWLDTQMITPIVANLGGLEIPRLKYLHMLYEARKQKCPHAIFSFDQ